MNFLTRLHQHVWVAFITHFAQLTFDILGKEEDCVASIASIHLLALLSLNTAPFFLDFTRAFSQILD